MIEGVSGHLHCKSGDDGDQVGGDGDSSVCVASQHLLKHVPQVQRAVVRPCLHQLTLHFQPSQDTAIIIITTTTTTTTIRKDYAFWRQLNEKPSNIPCCPGITTIIIIIIITSMIIRYSFRLLLFYCISR